MIPHLHHLSDDELIARLYGIGDDSDVHLADCRECSARLSAMGNVRMATITSVKNAPPVSGRLLAAQRQRVLGRVGQPLSIWSTQRWVPVAAAASLLAVALFLSRPMGSPAPVAVPSVSIEADTQLFTDVYSMERDIEPRAAAPIRALFEETSFEKESQ